MSVRGSSSHVNHRSLEYNTTHFEDCFMPTEPKKFNFADYLKSLDLSGFSSDDLYMLKQSNTLDNVDEYLRRHTGDQSKTDLVDVMRRIKAGHQGFLGTDHDPFEAECYSVMCRYEESRRRAGQPSYVATKLRQSGKKKHWKDVIETAVSKPLTEETHGFRALRELNLLDHSFEAFVLSCPTRFSEKAVATSYARLKESGFIL